MSQTLTTTELYKPTWTVRLQVTDEKSPASTEAEDYQHALKVANRFRGRDDWQGLLAIFANYAVIGASISIAEFGLPSGTSNLLRWGVYIAACLGITSRLRGFENLVHEASHYNLFRRPSTHYSLQFLYAFPVFRILEDYRSGHLIHHKHLGDPTRDPDLKRIVELGLDRVPEAPAYYLFVLPFSGSIHWEYLSTTFVDFWTMRQEYPAKAVFWGAVLAGVASFPAAARILVLYYAVPLFVLLPVLRYWAEAAEHIGLDMRGKFGSSRSNLGLLHQWFMNPHNDGYHAVHHLHAQVPFHQLPAAHGTLMKESAAFRSQTVRSDGIVESFQQMAQNPTVVKTSQTQALSKN